MGLTAPLPMERVHLVNPGRHRVARPTLTAFTPPVFDNPVTTGFYDDKSGDLFSADCSAHSWRMSRKRRRTSRRGSSVRASSSG